MRMKKFLSVLLMAAGLMSCGDDDKPFIPELNKLTSVTCTKNGNAFFNANITYDQDKQINRIILNTEGNQFTDNYIIVDKTISVSGVKMIDGSPTNPFVLVISDIRVKKSISVFRTCNTRQLVQLRNKRLIIISTRHKTCRHQKHT